MWDCKSCDDETRRLRGLCGRQRVSPGLPGAVVDVDGRVGVRGDLVVAGARGIFGDHIWDRCPVGLARRDDVRAMIDEHRLRGLGLVSGPMAAPARAALLIRAAELDALELTRQKGSG